MFSGALKFEGMLLKIKCVGCLFSSTSLVIYVCCVDVKHYYQEHNTPRRIQREFIQYFPFFPCQVLLSTALSPLDKLYETT